MDTKVIGCACCVLFVGVIVLACSFDTLEPTEYGIVSSITGYVDTQNVYRGGRHLIGPGHHFIRFPACQVNLEFSKAAGADSPPIQANTGKDKLDPDSGGQGVQVSVAMQYKFEIQDIQPVYKAFTTAYNNNYMTFAYQAISNAVQMFTPDQFWGGGSWEIVRASIEDQVNRTMISSGHVPITGLQLLEVDFKEKYENGIVNIQLQTQRRTTQAYQQEVTTVLKMIDILESETQAQIMKINADAQAASDLIVNQAAAEGFYMQQQAKMTSYAELAKALNWNYTQLVDFIKVQAINGGKGGGSDRLVVGVDQAF